MNSVTLFGNVGGDPEVKAVGQQGDQVAKFSLATTRSWKNKNGEKQEKTNWHTIEAWGKQAETIAKYVKKGSKLLVTGEIEYQEYEKNGEKRYFTKIKMDRFEFGGGAATGKSEQGGDQPVGKPTEAEDNPIPF